MILAFDGRTGDVVFINEDDLSLFSAAEQYPVADKGIHNIFQKDHDETDIIFLQPFFLHHLDCLDRGHGSPVGAFGSHGVINIGNSDHFCIGIDPEARKPEGIAAAVASFVVGQDRVFYVAVDIQIFYKEISFSGMRFDRDLLLFRISFSLLEQFLGNP